MEVQSTFLDKLSSEIRLSIYSHVFGLSLVIKPSSSDTALGMKKHPPEDTVYLPEADTSISSSILATSKFVFNEAIPVLYKDKIIRGTTRDLEQLLDNATFTEHAQYIEIAECISTYHDADFHSMLCRLQSLPKVRSLSILSDCLYFQGNGRTFTVAQFCEEANLGGAICIDIGKYRLDDKYSDFQFAHRRLVQLWPNVQSKPGNYDPFKDLESMQSKWPSQDDVLNRIPWYLQTSLRCWVGLFERYSNTESIRDLEPHDIPIHGPFLPDKAQAEILAEFEKSLWLPDMDDWDK